MKRVQVRLPVQENLSQKIMQRLLYKKAVLISNDMGFKGYVYRLKARYLLVNRRGVFGENLISKVLDEFLKIIKLILTLLFRAKKGFFNVSSKN